MRKNCEGKNERHRGTAQAVFQVEGLFIEFSILTERSKTAKKDQGNLIAKVFGG